MKHFVFFIVLTLLIISCSGEPSIGKPELRLVWAYYYEKEFITSFSRELTSSSRRDIMSSVATDFGLSADLIFSVLKKDDPDKYNKLFEK